MLIFEKITLVDPDENVDAGDSATYLTVFLAHLSRRLKVSYCDHSPSVVVVVRLSVRSQSLNNISS